MLMGSHTPIPACRAMCIDSIQKEEFAKIGIFTTSTECTTEPGKGPACPTNLFGNVDTTATVTENVNMWIGPDESYLIRFGAKFDPCMRQDSTVRSLARQTRYTECGGNGIECDAGGFAQGEGYSCCRNFGTYGMTPRDDCPNAAVNWLSEGGGYCEPKGQNPCEECIPAESNVQLFPCCIGNLGECNLRTESECAFENGISFTSESLCSHVSCLVELCDTIIGVSPSSHPPV